MQVAGAQSKVGYPKSVEYRASLKKNLGLLVGSCLFVWAGTHLLQDGSKVVVAWSAILLFGAGALVSLWRLIDRRPILKMTPEGLYYRSNGMIFVPWKETGPARKM